MKQTEQQEQEEQPQDECHQKALLLELDNVVVKGRELVYDVLSGILEEKDVEFSPGLFSQHCLYPPVKNYVPQLLHKSGRTRLSEDKLTDEVNEAVKLMFVDGNIKMNTGIAELIDGAIGSGARIGALTVFNGDITERIVEKLGLQEKDVETLSNGSEDKHVPSSDAWLKLAKNMKVPASCCVAVASSARACKAALSAGMRCAVLVDKFTAFQDFGGADFVLDDMDKDAIGRILGLLDF